MISIIVPIYNAAPYLHKCLDSIKGQTFHDYEVLMIDDGSTDESGKICSEFAMSDARFVYYKKTNSGVSATRNYGIDRANGEYITFIDADDFVSRDYIEAFISNQDLSRTDIVVQGIIEEKNGNADRQIEFPNFSVKSTDVDKELFYKLVMFRGPYCKLFRTSIIKENGIYFPLEISYGEDALFFYNYLLHCKRITFLSQCGYHYVVKSGDSLSTTIHEPQNLYYFFRERTTLIHKLQKQFQQDKYDFPHLKEINLYGLKTIVTSMKYWKKKPLECKQLIATMKYDGFLEYTTAQNLKDFLFLMFLRFNFNFTNNLLLKYIS